MCEINCPNKISCTMSNGKPIEELVKLSLLDECFQFNSTKVGLADGSRMLKKMLMKVFQPLHQGLKIRIKSNRYSMGDSIYVYVKCTDSEWEDIKPLGEMLCDLFEEGSFNGMNDSYEYAHDKRTGVTKYCFFNRDKD